MLDGDLFLKGGAQMKDQLTPKPGTPSADELFELAYNYRYHEALLGFLLMQGAGDTLACDNLYTLHGVIRGAYLQIMTGEGVTGIVRDAIMNAAGTAYEMLKSLVERDGVPHEYYRAAHMWGGMLERCGRAEEALAVVEEAFDHDVSGMPYMKNALTLLRLRLLQSGGRVAEAHALAASMALRPFLISDATHLAELSHQYGRLCREVGRLADFDRVMWRGLRVTRGNSSLRQRSLELLVDLYGGIEPLLARAGTASIERVVTMLAWSNRFLTGDRQGCRLVDDHNEWIDALLEVRNYQGPRAQHECFFSAPALRPGAESRILITRAMGGIGDLLMMTPGVRALKEAHPDKEIVFAIPPGLMPLLDGNPHCAVMDIHNEGLDVCDFGAWYNLTDCPASREECRTAPRVTRSRIDMFASGMGIGGEALMRMNRRPVYVIPECERADARDFLRRCGSGPFVAVQLQTADGYRDYPHMETAVGLLAETCDVLVFHDRPFRFLEHPRITKLPGLPLRRAMAIAGCCDVVLAPDSSFVHLAGALDIPCVGLFGPIDGQVRTRHYPKCKILDVSDALPCLPCWRNEYSPCRISAGRRSLCMADIAPRKVARVVLEAIHEYGPNAG
jgi:hypothetical protein